MLYVTFQIHWRNVTRHMVIFIFHDFFAKYCAKKMYLPRSVDLRKSKSRSLGDIWVPVRYLGFIEYVVCKFSDSLDKCSATYGNDYFSRFFAKYCSKKMWPTKSVDLRKSKSRPLVDIWVPVWCLGFIEYVVCKFSDALDKCSATYGNYYFLRFFYQNVLKRCVHWDRSMYESKNLGHRGTYECLCDV